MKPLQKIIAIVFLFAGSIAILQFCKKHTVPDITTTDASGITQTSAVSGGNVTNNGGVEVTARGVCWSTSQTPTISSNKTSDGTGNGSFSSNITGLTANVKYYVRAYAINSEGNGYGNEVSFTTNPLLLPTLTTTAITSITTTTAVSGGNITNDGGGTITARGVCWNTSPNPTTANNKTNDGTGSGSFTSNLTNLQPGTTYYVKAYASNSAGTGYDPSNAITFTTLCQAPSATTNAASNIASSTATLNGLVSAYNSSTTVTFEYGTTTSYGNTKTATQSPLTGTSNTSVSAAVTGLTPNTQYYCRVKADNCGGTTYGSAQSFKTLLNIPTNGLVAYYPFNGNANDESGYGNNGTLLSGAVITTDKNGNANKACSVNPGYVLVADNSSLDLANFTLSIWFKPEAVTSAFNCLIGKNYAIAYGIGFDSGGSGACPAPAGTKRPMAVYVGDHGFYFSASDFACGSNTWYHAAVTYNNSTGVVQLYVNGNLIQSASIAAGSMGNSTDPLGIGQDGHYGDKFTGDVDEVCIYNRVLSPAEINQLYTYY